MQKALKVFSFVFALLITLSFTTPAYAQLRENPTPTLTVQEATLSAEALKLKRETDTLNEATQAAKEASPSAEEAKKLEAIKGEDVTQP